ncbi:hypothetical protein AB0J83_45140 [Actinoplanes sp. NPDC049596]
MSAAEELDITSSPQVRRWFVVVDTVALFWIDLLRMRGGVSMCNGYLI